LPHAVERAYAVISPLLPPTPPQTCLWLTEQHHRQALERLLALPAGRLLAIAPGANWSGKIWPAARFKELIGTLCPHVDALLLLGGSGDVQVCGSVAESSPLPVLNVAGQTTLLEAAAL